MGQLGQIVTVASRGAGETPLALRQAKRTAAAFARHYGAKALAPDESKPPNTRPSKDVIRVRQLAMRAQNCLVSENVLQGRLLATKVFAGEYG